MIKIPLAVILAFTVFSAFAESEDAVLDRKKQDPVELLLERYNESKVLLLGLSGHENFQHLYYLKKLLEKIGTDQNLKYVVVERFADKDLFYEQLSTKDLKEVLGTYPFESDLSKQQTLCGTSEWAYGISEFMPYIQKINTLRSKENPLIVRSIDSVKSSVSMSWPGSGQDILSGTCPEESIRNHDWPALTFFVSSGNREVETSHNFEEMIWKQLQPKDKIIVLYHHAHLISGFTSCFPFMNSENDWVSNLAPMTWMNHFLNRNPNAKKVMSLVLFDNMMDKHFKFAERQMARYPDKELSVPLKPFKNILIDKGMDIFLPTSMLSAYQNGQHSSQLSLPELADGIIMNGSGGKDFTLDTQPATYLPDSCPVQVEE